MMSRAYPRTVVLAASIGLLAGAAHGLILWFERFVLGRLTWNSADVIWMAPLASAVSFSGLALLCLLPAALIRRQIPSELTVGVSSFLGLFSVLLFFGELSRWAVAVLALGVAWQLARRVRTSRVAWERGIVRAAIVLALGTAALGLGYRGILALKRALALQALPEARSGAPNVLLVIFDTVRRDELSLHGFPVPTTPALAQRAKRGTVFENAFATSSWTLPSHLSFLTGQLPDSVGPSWYRPVTMTGPTLAEVLQRHGYRTGGFVANLGYTSPATGLDRGFIDYESYPFTLDRVFRHAPLVQIGVVQELLAAKSPWYVKEALRRFSLETAHTPGGRPVQAPFITDRFLRWQAGLGNRPFFAFLNYFNAHEPYRAPPEFGRRFAPAGSPRQKYQAAIAYLDSELERLLDSLESRGALGRTLVIVTSDHGEHFGEHGLRGHANSLYLPALRVPLVLLYPGRVPEGRRIDQPVSLRDLPATILELLGIGSLELPGASLTGTWDSAGLAGPREPVYAWVTQGTDPRARAPNARTWLHSVVTERYHYIRSGLGEEELYDWRSDSLELEDLAQSPQGREIIGRLRARLDPDSTAR